MWISWRKEHFLVQGSQRRKRRLVTLRPWILMAQLKLTTVKAGKEMKSQINPFPTQAGLIMRNHEKLPTTKGKREQVLICIPTFMLRLDYKQQRAG